MTIERRRKYEKQIALEMNKQPTVTAAAAASAVVQTKTTKTIAANIVECSTRDWEQ